VGRPHSLSRKHGLLSADDIRAIRKQFGLTQRDLARLLRLGANTISRWEAGRNVQTEAKDVLLRLLRDVPGSLDYLSSWRTTDDDVQRSIEAITRAAKARPPGEPGSR
jgi:transcriptional regulator with XRE-family HTH domain